MFWDIIACSLVEAHRRFGGMFLPDSWDYIPEDSTVHSNCCGNLKSYEVGEDCNLLGW
jgi:hypothetical protein